MFVLPIITPLPSHLYLSLYLFLSLSYYISYHIHLHSITRRFLGVKETVKDYVPVDSESVTHNMWVLLMFRSVVVHIEGTYVFLSCTTSLEIFLVNLLILMHTFAM